MTKLKKSGEGVYFLSLSLENVRCFGTKQTLDLSDGKGRPAQWTVILGDNGTGKTTLLEVLAQGFTIFEDPKYSLRRIDSSNPKFESCFAFNNILENRHGSFQRYTHESEPVIGSSSGIPITIGDSFNISFKEDKLKIFFYSASRKLRKNTTNLFRDSAIKEQFNDQDELINAETWLLETSFVASVESEIQANYRERVKIIEDVLIKLLPDVKYIRISKPTKLSPNPRVEFKTPDGWLLLSQLSLGYQTMTAWMVDFTAQLFDCYPDSPNPIAEPAVVLIDEIDLHLHPKWQRTIMSYLSERFVNTQFIVTAHSPLIVQAAENSNIVVLKRENDGVVIHQQTQDVQGWRVDQLLASDLFGLEGSRSVKYEDLLDKRRAILGKAKLTPEDNEELQCLELEIGDLPTAETLEDIKAMDIIRRAAKLLEAEQ